MDAYITPQRINTHLDTINLSNAFKQGSSTKESIDRLCAGTAKHNPYYDKGVCSPIIAIPNPDGTLEWIGGYGMAPDTIGYINNKMKQIERKTTIKARLQQKLLQKRIVIG
jgi:hypothetical protein